MLLDSFFPTPFRNLRLALEVERILMASGVRVFGQARSTNLIYRTAAPPHEPWFPRLEHEGIRVQLAVLESPECGACRSGRFRLGGQEVSFMTGPAVDPEKKTRAGYVALAADCARLAAPHAEGLLESIDLALRRDGGQRLHVQLDLKSMPGASAS
jgi:hypothetical protein